MTRSTTDDASPSTKLGRVKIVAAAEAVDARVAMAAEAVTGVVGGAVAAAATRVPFDRPVFTRGARDVGVSESGAHRAQSSFRA